MQAFSFVRAVLFAASGTESDEVNPVLDVYAPPAAFIFNFAVLRLSLSFEYKNTGCNAWYWMIGGIWLSRLRIGGDEALSPGMAVDVGRFGSSI